MDLTLTVVTPETGSRCDVRLTAPDTAAAATVLARLRAVVGASADADLSIDGRPVAEDGMVADSNLVAGAIVVAGRPGPPPAPATRHLLVRCGPDSGRRWPLPDGEVVVGRDLQCQAQLADPAVSRRHLRLTLAAGAVTATDLSSGNGTEVRGVRLAPGEPVVVASGVPIRVGTSEMAIVDAVSPCCDDPVIHRSPRLTAPATVADIALPAAPAAASPIRIPILAALVPLLAGTVLALVLHQWQFLAFTVLSPVMILGQAGSDRWSARRNARKADRDHASATVVARHQLAEALDEERRQRLAAAPDPGTLVTAVSTREDLLWQRAGADPDGLVVRLGLGDLPCRTRVDGASGAATVTAAPVCLELAPPAVVGVCGPRELTLGLARSLVIQAATLHGPGDLRIVVVAPGRAADWAWVRWLPHVVAGRDQPAAGGVGFDAGQAASRLGELTSDRPPPAGRPSPVLVVVDDNGELRQSPAALALLESAHPAVSVIWCTAVPRGLPNACRAVAELADRPGLALTLTRAGAPAAVLGVAPDLMSGDVAEAAARALAPLRSAGAGEAHALPAAVRWTEINNLDLGDHVGATRALAREWLLAGSTEVVLGRSADGPLTVDLCRDGPHAVIAGTTGSGKSELLVSLVASLASRNRPDVLTFLLIDHKGGAAFGQCARLPHTVGVVTDLDGASTSRALLSLSAEIRRREGLLASVGAQDLAGYDAACRREGGAGERLPRLVIVVDEFATLVEEQPDFVGALVGIAQRGRSLGIHLILATQRPDGVVSADIRANTRLRICLGVARDSESRDVIDSPDATTISRTTPGRGYLRVGPGELREFQAARIGGDRTAAELVTVTFSPVESLGDPPPPAVSSADAPAATPGDFSVLVEAAVDLAATLGCATPPAPWLPPLPDDLPLSALPDAGPLIGWGLVDLPAIGQQRVLTSNPHHGATTVIAGTARSGRTSAALALALSAAARLGPDRLQIWAIDAGTGLAALSDLPHCGAVVAARETDRVERLLAHLAGAIADRGDHPSQDEPTAMLLIDSWEALGAAGTDRDSARVIDAVLRLAADGPSGGLHTVITSGRSGLAGRLGAVASEKVVLRLADNADFALLGMPGREVPRHLPPGRGVRAVDLSVVQIARPDEATMTRATAWPPPRRPPRSFPTLPRRIPLAELVAPADPSKGRPPGQIVLGRAADDLSRLSLARADLGPMFTVAGPRGSGRSTALALIAGQLGERRLAVSASRRSPLFGHPSAIELPRDDQDHAVAILESLSAASEHLPDLLIDDVDLLAEGPLWARLDDLIRAGNDHSTDLGRLIVLAATPQAVAAAFRGPLARVRRAQSGLLLGPASRHDGEPFGVTLDRTPSDDPPGRGWLMTRGQATRLQLADPGPPEPEVRCSPGSASALRWPVPARPSAPGCDRPASRHTAPGRLR